MFRNIILALAAVAALGTTAIVPTSGSAREFLSNHAQIKYGSQRAFTNQRHYHLAPLPGRHLRPSQSGETKHPGTKHTGRWQAGHFEHDGVTVWGYSVRNPCNPRKEHCPHVVRQHRGRR